MATETTGMGDRECMEEILRGESLGHLALRDGDGLYLVPLNYTYLDGRILFHCALEGKKLDLIRANPSVCFEASRQRGEPTPHAGDSCDSPFESVICWGTARIITDVAERQTVLNAFQQRYDSPSKTRAPITRERAEKCGAVEIIVTRMTGRRHVGEEELEWTWNGEQEDRSRGSQEAG